MGDLSYAEGVIALRVFQFCALALAAALPIVVQADQLPPVHSDNPGVLQQQEGFRVEGRTLNRVSGVPVRRVTLSLEPVDRPGASRTTVSDAQGYFLFDRVAPGAYRLSAERAGFLRQDYGARQPSTRGTPVSVTENLTRLMFQLLPQSVITGQVLDDEGEPAPNVDVVLFRPGGFGTARRLVKLDAVSTNDVGEFRIPGLEPGEYVLAANGRDAADGRATASGGREPEENFVTSFYPGTAAPAAALPVRVDPGQDASGMFIRLQKGRVVTVSGYVVSTSSTIRPQGIEIRLLPRGGLVGLPPLSAMTRADGSFEVHGVEAGTYDLFAIRLVGSAQVLGRASVELTSSIRDVALPLSEGVQLTGSVRFEGTPPAPGRGPTVILQPVDGTPVVPLSAPVDANGRFHFDGVFPDEYRMNFVSLPDGVYVQALRIAGRDVLGESIDLRRAPSRAILEITLSDKASVVQGVVLSEHNPAAGSVLLVPDPVRPNEPFLYKKSSTDFLGRFRFSGVAPGNYALLAWPDATDLTDYLDPEFVRPAERSAKRIAVMNGSQQNVEVTLIQPDSRER